MSAWLSDGVGVGAGAGVDPKGKLGLGVLSVLVSAVDDFEPNINPPVAGTEASVSSFLSSTLGAQKVNAPVAVAGLSSF